MRQTYSNFADGVNSTDSIPNIGPRQLNDALNVYSPERGACATRAGATQYGNTIGSDTGIFGLHEYLKYSTGIVYPLCVYGTDLYLLSTATWGAQSQSLTTSLAGSFVDAFDRTYFVNGTNNPRYFDGSTWTAVATIPNGTLIEFHENRLLVAGVSGHGEKIYFSNLGGHTFPATSYIKVERGVTAMISGDLYFYIFTEDEMYRFSKFVDFGGLYIGPQNLEKLPAHIGCCAPRSLVKLGSCMYFVARSGIYRSDGFDRICLTTDCKTHWDAIDKDYLSSACGAVFNDKYYVALRETGSSYNNIIFVFDTRTLHQTTSGELMPAFWPYEYTGIYPGRLAVVRASTGEKKLYCGDQSTGKLFQLEYGSTDNGSAIDSWMVKPVLHDVVPDLQKRLVKLAVRNDTLGTYREKIGWKPAEYSGQGYFEEEADLSVDGLVRGNFIRGDAVRGVPNMRDYYIKPKAHGSYFLVRVRTNTASSPFQVSNIGCQFRVKGRFQQRHGGE